MRIFFTFLLLISCTFSINLTKIKELKELGFTNQQITEMMKAEDQSSSSNSSNEKQIEVSKDIQRKLNKLKRQGKGLLVIAFTKEWMHKGPGFLDFALKSGDRWSHIGKADILAYSVDGRKSRTVSQVVQNPNWLIGGNQLVSESTDLVTSRYYGEFELKSGETEVKSYRTFHTANAGIWGAAKQKRHKKFHNVKIIPGKITLLSYFWKENAKFGLDHTPSQFHLKFENKIANGFGEYLGEVRVQHNE
ncbi:hypothetical protein MJH12_16960 [bacterium]|nr:hypothetical protein [bacterium]